MQDCYTNPKVPGSISMPTFILQLLNVVRICTRSPTLLEGACYRFDRVRVFIGLFRHSIQGWWGWVGGGGAHKLHEGGGGLNV